MEHTDCYKSYGHFYVQLARPVIAAGRRGALELGGDPARSRPRWGCATLTSRKSEDDLIREALASRRPLDRGHHARAARGRAVGAAADRPPVPALRQRSADALRQGRVPVGDDGPGGPARAAHLHAPGGRAGAHRADARRYPLQCIVPPNRFFLNSSFSQSELMRRRQRGAAVMLHPADAARPRDPDRRRGAGAERARRGAVHRRADRRHPRGRGGGGGDLVEQAPAGRARGQRAHRRPHHGHGRRARPALQPGAGGAPG